MPRVKGTYSDDENYRTDNVAVDAIAASTAQNDSGRFQLDFRDEKYLPFEGAGAVSLWLSPPVSEGTISTGIAGARVRRRDGDWQRRARSGGGRGATLSRCA